MSDKYTIVQDEDFGLWINQPENGGDVGGLHEICDELNRLLRERDNAKDWLGSYKESFAIASREIINLKSENAKLLDLAEKAIDYVTHYDDLIWLMEELKQIKEGAK